MVKLHKINTQYTNEELDITLEASAERQRVQKFMDDNLGKDYFDKYLKIRDRFTDMNLKDFNKIIKLDPENVKVAIDRYYTSNNSSSDSREGKRKVGENSDWVVYHVTTFPAAQELGEGTEWCITGRYGNMDPDDDHYFKNYIIDNNLDGGYYFYIPKNGSDDKYCLLLTKNGNIHSIWGTPNGQVYDISDLNFPDVKGIDYSSATNLEDSLREAYNNDDADEWASIYGQMVDNGDYVDFPSLDELVSDEKPNLFNFFVKEYDMLYYLSGTDANNLMAQIYDELPQYQRGDFLSSIGDTPWLDVHEVIEGISEDDAKSDFFLDYLDWFDFSGLVRDVGLRTVYYWSISTWFKQNDVLTRLIENEGSIRDVLDNLDFENMSYVEGFYLLSILENDGYMVDSTWEDLINLKDVITQILDELEDGGLDKDSLFYVEVIPKLGVELSKDDAKELKERIDGIEEEVPKEITKIVNKALK